MVIARFQRLYGGKSYQLPHGTVRDAKLVIIFDKHNFSAHL